MSGPSPHVVILGAGFGGMGVVKELARAGVRVTLIDRNNYHTFQPLLYQVATDVLGSSEVGFPVRQVLHGHPDWVFHKVAVTGIDLARKQVTLEGMAPLGYDYLVIALGAVVNFFGTKGAAEHARPLYTMHDAVRLKAHILGKFEEADRNPALIDDGVLTFCVVGGGATGVEVAGALAELVRMEMEDDYPNLAVERTEVHLYEMGPQLLGAFTPRLEAYARTALEKRGVHVHTGEGVVEIEPTRVHLKSGGVVKAHTLVWGAGLQANPLITRRCSWSATSRSSRTAARIGRCLSLVQSRSRRARGRAGTSPASSAASRRSPSSIETRAPWARSVEARPWWRRPLASP
jgi:NADH:ubiquinone reductase (H+-translocating)